jgi:hypothetical protein
MALPADIRTLRDRTVAELIAAHDHFADTKTAWLITRKVVESGSKFTHRNAVTGSVTTEAQLAAKSAGYVASRLPESTFQDFVSSFENFFFDLLRLWLLAYPQSLGAKELTFKTVLDAPDKEAITLHVVNKELNELAYERPREWFKYLESRMKLGCPTEDEIDWITEAKASRDVLTHNRGIVNRIYLSKAGKLARFADGEPLDVPEPYHRQTWELIRKVVTEMADAAAGKTGGG